MKKTILAAFVATALSGVAAAQEAPILYGDVSASTANTAQNNEVYRGEATPPREVIPDLPDLDLDLMATGSVEMSESDGEVTLEDATNPTMNDDLRGR